MTKICVLVVDDSALMRQVITSVLSRDRSIEVVTAADPLIAVRKIDGGRPDVILLDLEMPRMDGLTFLRQVRAESQIPVVVCSGHVGKGAVLGLRALEEGAVAIVEKPKVGLRGFLEDSAVMLIETIRGAAASRMGAPSVERPTSTRSVGVRGVASKQAWDRLAFNDVVVAIGASAGGTEALAEVLSCLPPRFPPVLVVQHMPEVFTAAFAQRLNERCSMLVSEATDGDRVVASRVLVAPGSRHMVLQSDSRRRFVRLVDGPLVSRHRPSVDVLFRSVAETSGGGSIGVLLTGMGSDGAEGMIEMHALGATTIAQNEATSAVFGMPQAAILRGAVDRVLPLGTIASALVEAASRDAVQELALPGG